MLKLVLVVAAVAYCTALVTGSERPGFKTRVTEKALAYVNDIAITTLRRNISAIAIPSVSGRTRGINYKIKSVRVTKFKPDYDCLQSTAKDGLVWTAKGIYLKIKGGYRLYKAFLSDSGSFDASIHDCGFRVPIKFDIDESGRPVAVAGKSSFYIGKVKFDFGGSPLSIVYNLFNNRAGRQLKKRLLEMIERKLNRIVNENLNSVLQEIPIHAMFTPMLQLDYGLTKKPDFHSKYVDIYHNGRMRYTGKNQFDMPSKPQGIAKYDSSDHMMYMWITDYMVNSLPHLVYNYNRGLFQGTITDDQLPERLRGLFATDCTGSSCLSSSIKGTALKFRNHIIVPYVKASSAPRVVITPDGIRFETLGQMDMHARQVGTTNETYFMTFNMTMTGQVKVEVSENGLSVSVDGVETFIEMVSSEIGPVSNGPGLFTFFIDEIVNHFIETTVNGGLSHGFPLPIAGDFKMVNTSLVLLQDAMLVRTDLLYTISLECPVVVPPSEAHRAEDILQAVLKMPANIDRRILRRLPSDQRQQLQARLQQARELYRTKLVQVQEQIACQRSFQD